MIEFCHELLLKNKSILYKYQQMYKYILIDEFQDINQEQYEIIKLICKTKNLFVVGDDDQSIYKFRGTKPTILNDFLKDYSNAKVINLNENFRSAQSIVKFSKRIIDNNKKRFSKDFVAHNKLSGSIEIKVFNDSIDENKYIIDIIKNKVNKGTRLSEIAILYRTNLLSNNIVGSLNKVNIDYIIKDKNNNIFDSFVRKDILDYFRLALGDIKL